MRESYEATAVSSGMSGCPEHQLAGAGSNTRQPRCRSKPYLGNVALGKGRDTPLSRSRGHDQRPVTGPFRDCCFVNIQVLCD